MKKQFLIIILALTTAIVAACGPVAPPVVQPALNVGSVPVAAAQDNPARPVGVKKVVILNSYEPEYWATVDENRGFEAGLKTMGFIEGDTAEFTRLYMRTKTVNSTPALMKAAVPEIMAQIIAASPDIVFITDDDALIHVGPKLRDANIPVVFSGINGLPTDPNYTEAGPLARSLQRPGYNITGVLERVSLKAGFDLVKEAAPQAQKALFITDDSALSHLILERFGGSAELKTVALDVVDVVYSNNFTEIQEQIVAHQNSVDVLALFLVFTIVDDQGNYVPQKRFMDWVLKNNRKPELVFWDTLVNDGAMMGVVTDLEQLGYQAGLMVGRVLLGESAGNIPIANPVANRIIFNLARADQLGIDIPFDILKNTDIVYLEMQANPDYKPAFQ